MFLFIRILLLTFSSSSLFFVRQLLAWFLYFRLIPLWICNLQAAVNAFMHQAQASSTTSLTADNCSSLDIKPSIQQNGTSQSSAPKQREGTTSSSGNTNTHNNNNSSSSNNNNNTNSSSNQSSSLNGGLFDNAQSVYGNSGSAYDNNYQSYHQANNVAAATGSFHSGNATSNGGIGGTNIASMRSNLSPPIHSHHHHHSSSLSSSSSVGNKPQRTKPRTSAGEKETTFLTFLYILTIDWSIILISPNSPYWTKLSIFYENKLSCSWNCQYVWKSI